MLTFSYSSRESCTQLFTEKVALWIRSAFWRREHGLISLSHTFSSMTMMAALNRDCGWMWQIWLVSFSALVTLHRWSNHSNPLPVTLLRKYQSRHSSTLLQLWSWGCLTRNKPSPQFVNWFSSCPHAGFIQGSSVAAVNAVLTTTGVLCKYLWHHNTRFESSWLKCVHFGTQKDLRKVSVLFRVPWAGWWLSGNPGYFPGKHPSKAPPFSLTESDPYCLQLKKILPFFKIQIWFYISRSLLPSVPSSSFWYTTCAPCHLLLFYLGAIFSSQLTSTSYVIGTWFPSSAKEFMVWVKIASLIKLKF